MLLHTLEEYRSDKGISLKATGHQWYWSYEYPELTTHVENKNFDSYMVADQDFGFGWTKTIRISKKYSEEKLHIFR